MGVINSLEDLFYHQLRDMYTTQQRFVKALSNPAESSSHREQGNTFRDHLEETSILRDQDPDESDTATRKHFSKSKFKI